jgi:hypothetical protein
MIARSGVTATDLSLLHHFWRSLDATRDHPPLHAEQPVAGPGEGGTEHVAQLASPQLTWSLSGVATNGTLRG